ncbi:hypothetical protein GO495_10880 [Chitinophaga oryziterrae]|uniref:Uncharacterized protein n=1 Tax=Chitinophaga oryziterrae TaxID=1031224 RepID=A0A6N8J9V0_9BACT|nr:hypothetical protein [Chitinophaga oryziterrae]MVT41086.1 hypothetical protein [Chitinophaga oryziterrae]
MQQIKSRQPGKDVNTGIMLFSRLHQVYDEGDIQTKQTLTSLIFKDYLMSDGTTIHSTRLNNAMNILYKQDTAFKGSFAFTNLPSRKPALTRGEEQRSVSSGNCDMLRRLLPEKITVKELRDTMEFIQILSGCIKNLIIK